MSFVCLINTQKLISPPQYDKRDHHSIQTQESYLEEKIHIKTLGHRMNAGGWRHADLDNGISNPQLCLLAPSGSLELHHFLSAQLGHCIFSVHYQHYFEKNLKLRLGKLTLAIEHGEVGVIVSIKVKFEYVFFNHHCRRICCKYEHCSLMSIRTKYNRNFSTTEIAKNFYRLIDTDIGYRPGPETKFSVIMLLVMNKKIKFSSSIYCTITVI